MENQEDEFLLDSGCNITLTGNLQILDGFKKVHGGQVMVADGSMQRFEGQGTITFMGK
jgi:hypothetical protein